MSYDYHTGICQAETTPSDVRRKGRDKEEVSVYYPLHEAELSKFVDADDNIVERN